ncbi:MAG: iron ABC transporter permease [Ottowia sp.]|nr:iron ABC transporter permease [Ottowia sp.]
MHLNPSYFWRWIGLIIVAASSILIALALGSVRQFDWQFIAQLRLPRVLTAFSCGGLLALAGALLQALTRNPLAEPYLLGVSGGAASGALLAMLGMGYAAWGVTLGASVGAMLSLCLLFSLLSLQNKTRTVFEIDHTSRLILAGVMLATAYGALISLLLLIAPSQRIPGMLFWMMGDLSSATIPWVALSACILCLISTPYLGARVNLLLLGEDRAYTLGLSVKPLRYLIILIAALTTACAVAHAGTIGFIGMVVPHTLRLWWGNDQRFLLPACLFVGGSLLTLADLASRTLIAPAQLPVGIITAGIGVPSFLWLMHRPSALK